MLRQFYTYLVIGGLLLMPHLSKAQYARLETDRNVYGSIFLTDLGWGTKFGLNAPVRNSPFVVGGELYGEWGRPFQVSSSSYGGTFNVGVAPFFLGYNFNFLIKAGLTGVYDILNGLPESHRGFGYGLRGGAEAQYYITRDVALGVFGNQSYLFKGYLGKKRY